MSSSYTPFGGGDKYAFGDVEGGLYPGISATDQMLRWGFVRKVYGVVGCQLALTTLVAALIYSNHSIQAFFIGNMAIQILLLVSSFVLLIPLFIYKDRHPLNLALLGAWTAVMSITVGMACSFYQPLIVLEALALTTGVVVGLTAYAFWATKRGANFSWMGPMLFGCLWALIIWSFVQIFLKPGPIGRTIFSLLGALLFSAYLVFDTWLTIRVADLDDWVAMSINIYLDILNLFLYLLRILGDAQRNGN